MNKIQKLIVYAAILIVIEAVFIFSFQHYYGETGFYKAILIVGLLLPILVPIGMHIIEAEQPEQSIWNAMIRFSISRLSIFRCNSFSTDSIILIILSLEYVLFGKFRFDLIIDNFLFNIIIVINLVITFFAGYTCAFITSILCISAYHMSFFEEFSFLIVFQKGYFLLVLHVPLLSICDVSVKRCFRN